MDPRAARLQFIRCRFGVPFCSVLVSWLFSLLILPGLAFPLSFLHCGVSTGHVLAFSLLVLLPCFPSCSTRLIIFLLLNSCSIFNSFFLGQCVRTAKYGCVQQHVVQVFDSPTGYTSCRWRAKKDFRMPGNCGQYIRLCKAHRGKKWSNRPQDRTRVPFARCKIEE